ncbi:MAG TPA: PEP-CTERM sorting domain-containing protein [Verrucomicrobiae bacterium]|jgi:hypothetical protein
MSSFGEWIRRAALMTALGGAALQVRAGTVDFTLYGTFQASSYTIDGVRVTGSSDVGVFQFNGLGVMGGIDFWLDGQEYLDFTFTQGPAIEVSYFVFAVGNLNPSLNSLLGESFVEVFGEQGESRGVFSNTGDGIKDVSDMVGGGPISRFRVTADVDNLRISAVSFTPSSDSVPEPSTVALLLLAGFGGLAPWRRRRQWRLSASFPHLLRIQTHAPAPISIRER